MRSLTFPRLSRLEVRGYEPYVSDAGDGFAHSFLDGVNVLVGINGLGKTTLLNIIFRMLVGPFDPAKADRDRPGRKQAGLVRIRDFDFFRKRAADGAADAWAEATFRFGTRTLTVRRSLSNLQLIHYALDGHETSAAIDPVATDDELMDILAILMGFDVDGARQRDSTAYRYDYDFVVRNLIFFLEEKIPLIWNPDGQFVILRVLLVDEELSEEISRARNDLLRADSQYRNRLWASNKAREELEEELAELTDASALAEEINLIVSAVGGLQKAHDDLLEQREHISAEIERVENQLLRARAAAFETQARLRRDEAAYFQQAFRSVRTPGDLILQALESHEGCLVCGNKDEGAYARARRLMDNRQCPVCEASTALEGDGALDYGAAALDRLVGAEDKAAADREQVAKLEQLLASLGQRYHEANEQFLEVSTNLDRERRRERTATASAEHLAKVTELRDRLTKIEDEVERLRATLQGFVAHHRSLVQQSQHFIEERSQAIIANFETYASAFMVEECRLRFLKDHQARVAQTDEKIDWPAFQIDLASGADAVVTKRSGAAEVSESQKEFIDLAFRMSLLRVASQGSASMLAVETPEASLDAFFVEKAGDLLRGYAEDTPGNILLVTSNLTREKMIDQLLGTTIGAEDLETRRRRTLNLLEVARPTKAYRLNQGFYDERYAEAVGEPLQPVSDGAEPAGEVEQ